MVNPWENIGAYKDKYMHAWVLDIKHQLVKYVTNIRLYLNFEALLKNSFKSSSVEVLSH